jgi:DNA-binding beta-propeller fold protein YncE
MKQDKVPDKKTMRGVIIIITFAVFVPFFVVVYLTACDDGGTGPSEGNVVGPGGGTASGKGVTINFPPGALERNTNITFNDWTGAPPLPGKLKSLAGGVKVGRANTTLGARTDLSYDVSAFIGSTQIKDIAIYGYDDANQGWFWIGAAPSADGKAVGGIIPFLGKVKPVKIASFNLAVSKPGRPPANLPLTDDASFDFTAVVKNNRRPVSGGKVEVGLAPYPKGYKGICYVRDGVTISAGGVRYTGRSEAKGWKADKTWTTGAKGKANCKIVLRNVNPTGYWFKVSAGGKAVWAALLFWPKGSGLNDREWTFWLPGGTWGGENRPPNAPSGPNPANGAAGVDVNKDVSWSCSDPDGDPLTYDVYFGTSSEPPLKKSGHTSKTYDPGTLNKNTKYYWKIVAKDNHAHATPGPIWYFTTRDGGGGPGYEYEGQWGTKGSGNGQFNTPYGVAVAPNGNVYVADSGNTRIQYFNATGSYLGKWGSQGSGNGQFNSPRGVTVAPGGNVYVSEYYNHRIQYFTANGSYLGQWGSYGWGNGEFCWPRGVGAAPNGNVYVADHSNYRIQYFTPNGSFLGKWGSEGGGNGQFYWPLGVAVAPSGGNVYVADTYNHRVQYFTASGSYLGKWGSRGSGNGQFDYPDDVAVARNGNVFVIERWNDRVQYFTANGSYLGKWDSAGSGIAVTPDASRVYVADTGNDRIKYFRKVGYSSAGGPLARVKALYQ